MDSSTSEDVGKSHSLLSLQPLLKLTHRRNSRSACSSISEDVGKSQLNKPQLLLSLQPLVFLFKRLAFGVFLMDLSAKVISYKLVLSNGMPTVVAFNTDWHEVYRGLAPHVYTLEKQYKGNVNFVMLKVNEFIVEGIPHFAFLYKERKLWGRKISSLLLLTVDCLKARVIQRWISLVVHFSYCLLHIKSHCEPTAFLRSLALPVLRKSRFIYK